MWFFYTGGPYTEVLISNKKKMYIGICKLWSLLSGGLNIQTVFGAGEAV